MAFKDNTPHFGLRVPPRRWKRSNFRTFTQIYATLSRPEHVQRLGRNGRQASGRLDGHEAINITIGLKEGAEKPGTLLAVNPSIRKVELLDDEGPTRR